jgi:SAM-dependent methyltransferase
LPEEPARQGRGLVQAEFERAAQGFAERTKGRFDSMDAPAFSELHRGQSILEVGAGTGNFLQLFSGIAGLRVALDLTPAMLAEARRRHEGLGLIAGDGARLPFRSAAFDLVASAQALHHIWQPVPVLKEMRRVAGKAGRVLIVDQIGSESLERIAFMNELELLRDPSHAMTRPPSAFRIMVQAAGLKIVKEQLWAGTQRLSKWMWPGEFPEERIDAVRSYIERLGTATDMGFEPDGDDWTFTRRRIMILAERA